MCHTSHTINFAVLMYCETTKIASKTALVLWGALKICPKNEYLFWTNFYEKVFLM
jgi:hypothetical protein